MPNQRSKDKTYLGGFIEKKLHRQILREARAAGMQHNKFGFVAEIIRKSLARRTAKPKPAKKRKAARSRA